MTGRTEGGPSVCQGEMQSDEARVRERERKRNEKAFGKLSDEIQDSYRKKFRGIVDTSAFISLDDEHRKPLKYIRDKHKLSLVVEKLYKSPEERHKWYQNYEEGKSEDKDKSFKDVLGRLPYDVMRVVDEQHLEWCLKNANALDTLRSYAPEAASEVEKSGLRSMHKDAFKDLPKEEKDKFERMIIFEELYGPSGQSSRSGQTE